MKKILYFCSLLIVTTLIFSCGGKKDDSKNATVAAVKPAENLNDLINKYDAKKFTDCDEFIAAGDEIIDVYVKRINEAAAGDGNAKIDVLEFEELLKKFDQQAVELSKTCPEKFEHWAERSDVKVAAVNEKLIAIFTDSELPEWDEEKIQQELDAQLDELNKDLKEVAKENIGNK